MDTVTMDLDFFFSLNKWLLVLKRLFSNMFYELLKPCLWYIFDFGQLK